jgi:type VII secretion-associated serine protease mycosin
VIAESFRRARGVSLRAPQPRPGRLCHGVRAVVAACVIVAAVVVAAPPASADAVRSAQWHLRFLKTTQAHRITQGAGVTVAVLDTGVDAGHPDLAGAVLSGTDVALSPEGRRDGRTDLDGHGTSMAGLIAARGRGGSRGALGIAPKAKILPVRVIESSAPGTSNAAAGIAWAVAHGAEVISMSFAGRDPSDDVRVAVEAAQRANVVLVAGVGNRPLSQRVDYPAAYPGVLAVAGVDRRGRHADISVTGPEVQVAAPAVDIVSTDRRGGTGYRRGVGTSDATAIVAGVAALVRARYPDLPAAEVVHRLTATARDAGAAGRDEQYGFGVIDPMAALTADVPPMPAATVPAPATTSAAAPPWRPAPVAGRDEPGAPMGLLAVGLGCLLLVCATAGGAVWLLVRRRHA